MQLTYRGQTYIYTPAAPKAAAPSSSIICPLFYRGHSYFKLITVSERQLPGAINWRFAIPRKPQLILNPAT